MKVFFLLIIIYLVEEGEIKENVYERSSTPQIDISKLSPKYVKTQPTSEDSFENCTPSYKRNEKWGNRNKDNKKPKVNPNDLWKDDNNSSNGWGSGNNSGWGETKKDESKPKEDNSKVKEQPKTVENKGGWGDNLSGWGNGNSKSDGSEWKHPTEDSKQNDKSNSGWASSNDRKSSSNDSWGSGKSSSNDAWGNGKSSSNELWGGSGNRFGRGRGGGGGGGGRECFICHKTGHFARECPEKDSQANNNRRFNKSYDNNNSSRHSDWGSSSSPSSFHRNSGGNSNNNNDNDWTRRDRSPQRFNHSSSPGSYQSSSPLQSSQSPPPQQQSYSNQLYQSPQSSYNNTANSYYSNPQQSYQPPPQPSNAPYNNNSNGFAVPPMPLYSSQPPPPQDSYYNNHINNNSVLQSYDVDPKQVYWSGRLCKQNDFFCTASFYLLLAQIDPFSIRFPSTIDFPLRTNFSAVINVAQCSTPHILFYLFPYASTDREGYERLLRYMKDKNRCVVSDVCGGKLFLFPKGAQTDVFHITSLDEGTIVGLFRRKYTN